MHATAPVKGPTRDGLARVREACEYLALSRAAVYSLMDKGELKFVKIGKARRIPWPALVALVERHSVSAR
jgi:excisionase family DNA binding protein